MNGAHLHLLINHLPIVSTYISVLVLIAGFVLKNSVVKNTGLALLVFASIIAIPAQLTGESAEHILRASKLANHDIIEAHEETAAWAIWVSEFTGIIALLALFASYRKIQLQKTLLITSTVLAVLTSFAWIKVGNTGGEIRHTEIRKGNTIEQAAE